MGVYREELNHNSTPGKRCGCVRRAFSSIKKWVSGAALEVPVSSSAGVFLSQIWSNGPFRQSYDPYCSKPPAWNQEGFLFKKSQPTDPIPITLPSGNSMPHKELRQTAHRLWTFRKPLDINLKMQYDQNESEMVWFVFRYLTKRSYFAIVALGASTWCWGNNVKCATPAQYHGKEQKDERSNQKRTGSGQWRV